MGQGEDENVQSKKYTVADLKAHTSETSCYLLVHGKVHDVTEFLDEHPGGMHPPPRTCSPVSMHQEYCCSGVLHITSRVAHQLAVGQPLCLGFTGVRLSLPLCTVRCRQFMMIKSALSRLPVPKRG